MIESYKFVLWYPYQEDPTEFTVRDMDRARQTAERLLADYAAGKCDCSATQKGPVVIYEAFYYDETEG